MVLDLEKRRLLYESVFVLIGKQTLILKNGENKSFLKETKASMSFIPLQGMSLWCLIMIKKGEYYVNLCLSQVINEFNSKKW